MSSRPDALAQLEQVGDGVAEVFAVERRLSRLVASARSCSLMLNFMRRRAKIVLRGSKNIPWNSWWRVERRDRPGAACGKISAAFF